MKKNSTIHGFRQPIGNFRKRPIVTKIARLLLLTCLLFTLASSAFSQQAKVTGKVTDATTGEVLPGVTILIKGTTKGAVTDGNGMYSLDVPDKNAVLVFSSISYTPQTIPVSGKSVIDVSLLASSKSLDEVVVVGYGTAKRSNLTTAQTSVTSKDMERTMNTTLEQAIQGRTASTYITQNSGQPGGGISVNIRGVNSINGSNEPLYVIDGVQIAGSSVNYGPQSSSNPLSGLNPNDIADIQVLQGPSATALYGSRATNGVLLITTKRGKAGDTKITYNYQFALQTPPRHLDVMNLQQYAQYVKEFHSILGGTTPQEFLDPSILGTGTDWQKELFKNAIMNKHQLSMSGGKDKTTYYFSGEYLKQDGVADGSGFDRYSFRLNLDNKPREWVAIGTNISFNHIKENLTSSQENVISNGLQLTPQIPVKNIDGTWGGGDVTNGANQYAPVNPVALASMISNNNSRSQLLGGINVDLNLVKGLTIRTTFNGNLGFSNSSYFIPTYKIGWAENATASLSEGNGLNSYWNWNQLIQYNKQVGKHTFDLMASHESQASTWKNNTGGIKGFVTNDIIDINAGDPTTASASGGQGEWAMESFLGRFNYNYGERYIVSASIRKDGSSNFGADNRWGTFPAVSAAWRISKEPFYNIRFMNEFKLRLETGVTGNQGWGGIYAPMRTGATQWGTGFLPSKFANPGLKWEETKTDNIGVNLGFFGNRIQLEADYYKKSTKNLIMDNPEPWYMGTSGNGGPGAPTVNIGSMENKGWGFTLITTNINRNNFKWESNFNISGFKTKITKLYSDAAFINRTSWWMNNWTQQAAYGKAPWLFLGYQQSGIFQTLDDVNASAVPSDNSGNRIPTNTDNVWVGDVKYVDQNGDGLINVNDQTVIGNPWPQFFGGFTNNISYKGLEMSVLLTFTQGNDIYNYLYMVNSMPNNVNLSRNLRVNAINYAKPITKDDGSIVLDNPGTDLPRLTYGKNGNWERFTDRWVEDGSYLRVKNITVSYTIPSSLISKQRVVKDIKVSLSAQNVATLTKYKGFDPEVGAYVGRDASNVNQAIGIDYGRYPLTPVYTFNIVVNL
jgi:TonB-dependent starch-binding outer membrane protein SusC